MVETLTDNTDLINILHRLGHAVSYSLLLEAQTEKTFQKLMSKLFLAAFFQTNVTPILSESTMQTTLIVMRRRCLV